jgi:arylsulfatase A-like enzyme
VGNGVELAVAPTCSPPPTYGLEPPMPRVQIAGLSRPLIFFLVPTIFLGLLLLPGCVTPSGEDPSPRNSQGPIDLVAYVVVDQLRADLLDRYDPVFTGGFARLRAEGHRWVNATYDHAQTSTSPGHATATNGVHPHRHGLVGNSWMERTENGWESVYALRDLGSPVVGFPELEGRGPANLDRKGFADWLTEANAGSRVVSLSGKDRAAIAMAGHVPGHVYWLDGEVAHFLTSEYYRSEYPEWVDRFHRDEFPRIWSDTVWHSQVPDWAAGLSRPDTFPYEGDGINTYFPHWAKNEVEDLSSEAELGAWRERGPYPDKATLALARIAVQELELGMRNAPDYLALALSQVDRVGHDYGPRSREQLDNLIRLDRGLGEFMDFLDREVGEGRWMMALTGDHGVIDLPEARAEAGLDGRRITPAESEELLQSAEAAAGAAGDDPLARARAAAQAALTQDWIEDAFAWEDLLSGQPADSLQALFLHSYHPDRALGPLGHLGVAIRTVEGAYSGRYPAGTGHGSPYYFDRHVPFILMAPGVPSGMSEERVSIVDLAPTVAHLMGIPTPNDLDGRVVLP